MNKGDFKIAICRNEKIFNHSGSWTNTWIKYCKSANVYYEVVDCYQSDIIEKLSNFNCLLWHINNYVFPDMYFGRSILYSAHNQGLLTFPDFKTSWHFDDKIAETYLLQSGNISIPRSWMFYLPEDCYSWLHTEAKFPLIAKLRTGSGSNNVKLLNNKDEALAYTKKMFSSGFKSYPDVMFKTKSQLLSATDWKSIISRIKRAPEFFHTLNRAKSFPTEKGYVFFQEFIPNDGFDLKVVVIGDKLGFIGRKTRKGDYRASGGGDLFFDRELISRELIDSAFSTNDQMGFQCMGYDYVIDKNTNKGIIIEISYGFSHLALLNSGGYFDRNGNWYNEPLNAPEEIIKNILKNEIR
jgi:glutathione synthase/RimK-type ligase-like ATP-grasp enzyme